MKRRGRGIACMWYPIGFTVAANPSAAVVKVNEDGTATLLTGTVETGQGAHGVVVDPSGRQAYVTNLYDNDVAVLDLDELRVVGRIPVGDKPNGISFSTVTVGVRAPVTIELPEGQDSEEQHGGDGH